MRKNKKAGSLETAGPFIGASSNHLSAKAEFSERPADGEKKAKKEISGVWVLLFLVGLLILLVVQHWLRQ